MGASLLYSQHVGVIGRGVNTSPVLAVGVHEIQVSALFSAPTVTPRSVAPLFSVPTVAPRSVSPRVCVEHHRRHNGRVLALTFVFSGARTRTTVAAGAPVAPSTLLRFDGLFGVWTLTRIANNVGWSNAGL